MRIDEIWRASFYGNSASAWLIALVVATVGVPILLAVRRLLATRTEKLTARTNTTYDNAAPIVVRRTHGLFLIVVASFAASLTLELPDAAREHLRTAISAALFVQMGLWASSALRFWQAQSAKASLSSASSFTAIAFLGRIVVWALVVVLLLDNFGIEVTALIATLGVGGIAVALAAQSVLGDLLAAISIFLDKPFVLGDFIIVDDYLGTIESVGLRSTRINSLSGERIVMSNSDLLKSRIRNYKQMTERRVVFQIGVRYGTPHDAVSAIPGIVRAAVEAESPTRFDRSHFKGFGESSLDFETVYYVLSSSYNDYMDVQQAINLTILRGFEERQIAFAHPIRMATVAMAGDRRDHGDHGGSAAPSSGLPA